MSGWQAAKPRTAIGFQLGTIIRVACGWPAAKPRTAVGSPLGTAEVFCSWRLFVHILLQSSGFEATPDSKPRENIVKVLKARPCGHVETEGCIEEPLDH